MLSMRKMYDSGACRNVVTYGWTATRGFKVRPPGQMEWQSCPFKDDKAWRL